MPGDELATGRDTAHFVAPPPVPDDPPVDEPPVDEPPVAPPVPDVPPVPPVSSSAGSESSVVHAVVKPSKKRVIPPIKNLSLRVTCSMLSPYLKAASINAACKMRCCRARSRSSCPA